MMNSNTSGSATTDDKTPELKIKTLKELWHGYYYSIAYKNKLITEKTLKKFWHYPLYNDKELEGAFYTLKTAISDKDFFVEIADELLQKPWLDLYVEASKFYPNFFRSHFNRDKKRYTKFISNYMFQVMSSLRDTSEEAYLTYTGNDLLMVSDNLFLVSKFWIARNYYKVLKIINAFWAFQIYQEAERLYNQYLEDLKLINDNSQSDAAEIFNSVKTVYGRLVVLDKIWSKIEITGNCSRPIDYKPMIIYKKEILRILEEVFSLGDDDMIKSVSAIIFAMHTVYTLDKNYNDFKKRSKELYEKYAVNNSIIAQELKKLKTL